MPPWPWEEPLPVATKPQGETNPREAQLGQAQGCDDLGGKSKVAHVPGAELSLVKCESWEAGGSIQGCKMTCKTQGIRNDRAQLASVRLGASVVGSEEEAGVQRLMLVLPLPVHQEGLSGPVPQDTDLLGFHLCKQGSFPRLVYRAKWLVSACQAAPPPLSSVRWVTGAPIRTGSVAVTWPFSLCNQDRPYEAPGHMSLSVPPISYFFGNEFQPP